MRAITALARATAALLGGMAALMGATVPLMRATAAPAGAALSLARAMTAPAGAIAALPSGDAPIRVAKRESRYSNVRTALTSAAAIPGSLPAWPADSTIQIWDFGRALWSFQAVMGGAMTS